MNNKIKNKTKYCIVCGKPFEAETPWHKYCSRKCQSQRYRENRGIKLKDGRYCRQCGKHFYPDIHQQNRQHCSDECAVQSARQSRYKFYERNPQKSFEYYARMRQKHGVDANMKRFLARFPDTPKACQSCGENRVLDIAHKPQFRRNGAWRSKKNTTPERVWILCPTCHALLDRKHYSPESLGLF
jgi:predicted nucleic acid-binding Zn ribbon protein